MLKPRIWHAALALMAFSTFGGSATAKDAWVNFKSAEIDFSYPMAMGMKLNSNKVEAYPLPSPDDKPDHVAPLIVVIVLLFECAARLNRWLFAELERLFFFAHPDMA